MFLGAYRIGSVRGIDIRIDASWLVISVLIAGTLWYQFSNFYGHPPASAVVLAGIVTVLFGVSILAHELAHGLEAKHRGVHVSAITLFIFGGVTETRFDVRRPRDEFALSAIGPYVSFVLAAAFGLVSWYAQIVGVAAVADVAGIIGWINLMLGAFNLLPGAPLDGGRILRSLVWWVTRNRRRAIRVAAFSGLLVGGMIGAAGLLLLVFTFDLVNGAWAMLIGWFLMRAASAELAQAELQGLLEGRTVGSLVSASAPALPASATLDDIADDLTRSNADAHPVVDDHEVVGVVHVEDVSRVFRPQRAATRVAEIMRPLGQVETIRAAAPVSEALERAGKSDVIAVRDDHERVIGVLTPRDLVAALRRVRAVHGDPPRRRRRRSSHLPGEGRA